MGQTEAENRTIRMDEVSKKYDLCLETIRRVEQNAEGVRRRQTHVLENALYKVELDLRDYRSKIEEHLQERTKDLNLQIRELEDKVSKIETVLDQDCDITAVQKALEDLVKDHTNEISAKLADLEARQGEIEEDLTRTYKSSSVRVDEIIEREKV